METYVTSPIEAAIQGVRGVRRTSSQSSDETSSLTVELEPKADVQLARLAILERLELLRPEFPPGVVAPTVSNYVPENLEEQPLLLFTVSGPYTPGTLQKLRERDGEPAAQLRLRRLRHVGAGRHRSRCLRLVRCRGCCASSASRPPRSRRRSAKRASCRR